MITIPKAVLLWTPSKTADAEQWPLPLSQKGFDYSVGAVFADYRKASLTTQQTILLVEAIQAIVRDGVEPKSVLSALCKIKGMKELFAEDALP